MDHFDPGHLTAAQCRARAAFIRQTAEARHVDEVRQNLLDLAERYERFAMLLQLGGITDAA
jgi:hypothetical protein